jgi:hypothetical protein
MQQHMRSRNDIGTLNAVAVYGRRRASVFAHKFFNLAHDTIEFVNEIRVIAVLPKRGHQTSVIPNGALFLPTEPFEHFETMSSKLSQNRPGVM